MPRTPSGPGRRSRQVTSAPAATSRHATAPPRPDAPPVTITGTSASGSARRGMGVFGEVLMPAVYPGPAAAEKRFSPGPVPRAAGVHPAPTRPTRPTGVAEDSIPVAHEAVDREAGPGGDPAGRPHASGQARIGDQRLHDVDEAAPVGGDEPVHPVGDHGGQLGGGEADDGQAHGHRLAQRQAEARVADGVEVEAVRRHRAGELGWGHLAEPAQLLGGHADEVEGDLLPRLEEDVEPEAPATLGEAVDHGDPTGEAARVPGVVGHDHAVVDHGGGGAAAVPHQVVERGDVHDRARRGRRPGGGCRSATRAAGRARPRSGAPPAGRGEHLVAVDEPVLVGLVDDGVDVDVGQPVDRYLARPSRATGSRRPGRRSRAGARAARAGGSRGGRATGTRGSCRGRAR